MRFRETATRDDTSASVRKCSSGEATLPVNSHMAHQMSTLAAICPDIIIGKFFEN
jgi:hypothetical protein